ncbi:MAG: hypothetical protein ACRET7_15245 [Burkholderiales bacterium]
MGLRLPPVHPYPSPNRIPCVQVGETAAPGATRSASSAGLTPPGQTKQSNRDAADDKKSSEAKEKPAALTETARDTASGPVASLDRLPTCR